MSDDPFDLNDATIKDADHVQVTRKAPLHQGTPCTYWKVFQSGGISHAAYWTERENKLITGLWAKSVKRVVKLHNITIAPDPKRPHVSPITAQIATFDAGLTVWQWRQQQPCYADGTVLAHPFQPISVLLALAGACLEALHTIHVKGYVHLDLRDDNLCLPYTPYPYRDGGPVTLDFARLALIDFGFSISRDNPLQHPLPMQSTGFGQSKWLRQALDTDAAGPGQPPFAADALDWRCDLVSLGYLLENIAERGVLATGPLGLQAQMWLNALIAELKGYDDGDPATPPLPHQRLMAEIQAWQDRLPSATPYLSFSVERQAAPIPKPHGWLATARLKWRRHKPTPVIPLPYDSSRWPRRLRRLAYSVAAGIGLVLALPPAQAWWQRQQLRSEYEAIKTSAAFQAWWNSGDDAQWTPAVAGRWHTLGEQLIGQGDLHAAIELAAADQAMGAGDSVAWRYLHTHRAALQQLAADGPPDWQAAARQALAKMQGG